MQLQVIQEKIYEGKGQKIMLDFDLAELYEVETRVLNQAVKRNIDIFPDDFMFQLSKKDRIAESKKARQTSIAIVRAFIALKQFALNYKELADKLKELESKYNQQFKDVYEAITYLLQKDKLETEQSQRKRIGFKTKDDD